MHFTIYKGAIDCREHNSSANIPLMYCFSCCELIGEKPNLRRNEFTPADSRLSRLSHRSRAFRRQTRRCANNSLPHDVQARKMHGKLRLLPPSQNQPQQTRTPLKSYMANFSHPKRPQKNQNRHRTPQNTAHMHPSPKLPSRLHAPRSPRHSHKATRQHPRFGLLPTPKQTKHAAPSESRRRQNRHSIGRGNRKTVQPSQRRHRKRTLHLEPTIQTTPRSHQPLRKRKRKHPPNHRPRRNRKTSRQSHPKMRRHEHSPSPLRLHTHPRNNPRKQTPTQPRILQTHPTRQTPNRKRQHPPNQHALRRRRQNHQLRHRYGATNADSGNRQTIPHLRMPRLQPSLLQRKTKRTHLQLPPNPTPRRNHNHKTTAKNQHITLSEFSHPTPSYPFPRAWASVESPVPPTAKNPTSYSLSAALSQVSSPDKKSSETHPYPAVPEDP
jgi:hypothetical protein